MDPMLLRLPPTGFFHSKGKSMNGNTNQYLRALLDELARATPRRDEVLQHLGCLVHLVSDNHELPEVDTSQPMGTYEVRAS